MIIELVRLLFRVLKPLRKVDVRLEGERRDYGQTDAEVPFYPSITDRTWRAGARLGWHPRPVWNLQGGYWLNWGFGAAESAVDFRADYLPTPALSVGARVAAFQQLWEFRVGEGRTWRLGVDARWKTPAGTLWGALERYRNDRRDDTAQVDWTQWRAAFGVSYYVGSEPGRAP